MTSAKEVMVPNVITVKESDTIQTVLEKFVKYNISGVPVINDSNEPVGFISDGDIMKYIAHQDPRVIDFFTIVMAWYDDETIDDKIENLLKLNVLQLASRTVIKVDAGREIDEVARVLSQKRVKKVPVVKDKALVGIISRGDVVRFIASRFLKEKADA